MTNFKRGDHISESFYYYACVFLSTIPTVPYDTRTLFRITVLLSSIIIFLDTGSFLSCRNEEYQFRRKKPPSSKQEANNDTYSCQILFTEESSQEHMLRLLNSEASAQMRQKILISFRVSGSLQSSSCGITVWESKRYRWVEMTQDFLYYPGHMLSAINATLRNSLPTL
jgi:hypothetical protein